MNKSITRTSKEDLNSIFYRIFLDYPKDCKIIDWKVDWRTESLELKLESEIFNKNADYAQMPLRVFTESSEINRDKIDLINEKNKLEDELLKSDKKIKELKDQKVKLLDSRYNLIDEVSNLRREIMLLKERGLLKRIINANS